MSQAQECFDLAANVRNTPLDHTPLGPWNTCGGGGLYNESDHPWGGYPNLRIARTGYDATANLNNSCGINVGFIYWGCIAFSITLRPRPLH